MKPVFDEAQDLGPELLDLRADREVHEGSSPERPVEYRRADRLE